MARKSVRIVPAAIRVAAVAAAIAVAAASDVAAQTLTEPNGAKRAVPAHAAKPAKTHMESCGQYGVGFVYVPATGTCIKVGGSIDGSVGAGR